MNTSLKALAVLGLLTAATAAHAQILPNNKDAVQEQNDFDSLGLQNAEDAAVAEEAVQGQKAGVAAKSEADQALATARAAEQEAKAADAEAKAADEAARKTFSNLLRK